jgi:murein DD-endopeptidase MepM/ murein hydrolase activator NlpD
VLWLVWLVMSLFHRRAPLLALAVLLVASLAVSGADAQSPPTDPRGRQREIDRQLQELREQVSEASAEEAQLLTELGETRGRLSSIETTIAQYDVSIADATGRLAAAEQVVAQLDLRIGGVNDRITATEAERVEVTELRTEAIVELYMGQTPDPLSGLAELVLDGDDAVDVLRAQEYLEGRTLDASTYTDELEAIQEDLDRLHDELETARAQAEEARGQVEAERVQLQQLRDEQQVLLDAAQTEEANEVALVQDAQQRQDEFEAEISALEAESASIASYLRSLQTRSAPAGIAQSGSGQFQRPVPGAVGSPFGYRTHPILRTQRLHTGADMRAGSGDTIVAAEDGVVVFAGWRGGYGNCTIIDHGGGLATLYAHQSAILVSQGETVERGQAIGRVGSTGMSTGPHLHFEVRQFGTPVDPVPYI